MTTPFLDEKSGLTEIKNAIETSSTSKIAVAFWGQGAVDMLGMANTKASIRVICNLDSGACNPSEIRKLTTLQNVEVRAHSQLHAKVYWTPSKVIVGSSNASTNGLAVETPRLQGWLEANVVSHDPDTISSAETWFDGVFDQSKKVDEDALAIAEVAWTTRKKVEPPVADLLKTFMANPELDVWNEVKVTISRHAVNRAPLDAQLEAYPQEKELAGQEPYQNVKGLVGPGDWLVDFDYTGEVAVFTGCWSAADPLDVVGEYTFTKRVQWVEPPALGRMAVSEQDLTKISTLADKLMEKLDLDRDGFIAAPIRHVAPILAAEGSRDAKSGSYLHALRSAGLPIWSPRGLWGGVTPDGVPVVTSWTDALTEDGYKIWKPQRNYAGLKKFWEDGKMVLGTPVRLVLLTPKLNSRDGKASVRSASYVGEEWIVSRFLDDEQTVAEIVPSAATATN